MSLYPLDKDRWRRLVDTIDQMVAADFNALYAACVAIEHELGLKPSGKFGSVYSRVFGTGHVAKRSGLWAKISHRLVTHQAARFARNHPTGAVHFWRQGQMRGNDTVFGENVPACFGALQFPLAVRAAVPWRTFLVRPGEDSASWSGRDGTNLDFNLNDASQVQFGVLCWNIHG